MKKVAVLIPCYNEEKTVEKVVADYRRALPQALGAEGRVRHARHRREHGPARKADAAYAHHTMSSPTGQWSLPVISGQMNARCMFPATRSEQRK